MVTGAESGMALTSFPELFPSKKAPFPRLEGKSAGNEVGVACKARGRDYLHESKVCSNNPPAARAKRGKTFARQMTINLGFATDWLKNSTICSTLLGGVGVGGVGRSKREVYHIDFQQST